MPRPRGPAAGDPAGRGRGLEAFFGWPLGRDTRGVRGGGASTPSAPGVALRSGRRSAGRGARNPRSLFPLVSPPPPLSPGAAPGLPALSSAPSPPSATLSPDGRHPCPLVSSPAPPGPTPLCRDCKPRAPAPTPRPGLAAEERGTRSAESSRPFPSPQLRSPLSRTAEMQGPQPSSPDPRGNGRGSMPQKAPPGAPAPLRGGRGSRPRKQGAHAQRPRELRWRGAEGGAPGSQSPSTQRRLGGALGSPEATWAEGWRNQPAPTRSRGMGSWNEDAAGG